MKRIPRKTISLCLASIMTITMGFTSFATETRSYFSEMGMAPAPYKVTNVISDNTIKDISDNLPSWYKEENVFAWGNEMVGSVEITKDSIITLEFPHDNGVTLREFSNPPNELQYLEILEAFGDKPEITNLSDYIDIKNDNLITDEYGSTYYDEGLTVQFKKMEPTCFL